MAADQTSKRPAWMSTDNLTALEFMLRYSAKPAGEVHARDCARYIVGHHVPCDCDPRTRWYADHR